SEARHTPGPWTVLPEELDRDYIRTRGTVLGGRYKIANVLQPSGRNLSKELRKREAEETRANVRLIAAAPKLLAALERLISNRHYFMTSHEDKGTCAQCGENFRHGVHYRVGES